MAVTTFTFPYTATPPFYSGIATSSVVPNIFPVAIDGRAYMVDQKSGQFQRSYEQRVRDSQDTSTTPGEAAINPGGLWRRGQDSWHYGAGQSYADTAESKDYRFYKSKGINPWVKGQLSLLNQTKLSLASAATAQHMVVQGTRIYASLGGDVKHTTDPYITSPTWSDCTGEPLSDCAAMATDGSDVYLAFPSDGVRLIDTSVSVSVIGATRFAGGTNSYYMLGFAKSYMFGAYNHLLNLISSAGVVTAILTPDNINFRWVGVATGQNAVYVAGYSDQKSLIYKITIKADGTLDTGIVALELPTGEVVTTISGYLGFILVGTNKGVRYCSTDSNSNLIAGQIIPTSGAVHKFASNDRFVYFTWTNYDGISSGLGTLDLSVFISPNTPAFATDLMYGTSSAITTDVVRNVVVFTDPVSGASKKVFTISGVGVVAEDSSSLNTIGEVESGTWRWGIPDRKFIAKIDTRSTPLVGSIESFLKIDDGAYVSMGTWSTSADTENSFGGSDDKAIEASFKYKLTREATAVTTGPTLTRWMARAYAAPFRSQVFAIPVLLHNSVTAKNKEYYYDVAEHQAFFDDLIANPRIVTLQLGTVTHNVIAEDLVFVPQDSYGNTWEFNGTLVVTLRSVEN